MDVAFSCGDLKLAAVSWIGKPVTAVSSSRQEAFTVESSLQSMAALPTISMS